MGKKKTKTTEVNRPVYDAEIGAASRANQAAYTGALPAINEYADNARGASNDLFARFREGDPTMMAAQGYIQDTLSGDPTQNPYLDDIVNISNDNVRNQLQARMGTRGQTGGSDYYDMIGRSLAENETGLRYSDYNNAMQRRAQAAGMAPGITAGSLLPLDAAMRSGQSGAMAPLQAAALNSASTGGLLGQYQNREGTQTQSGGLFGAIIGSALGGLASNPAIFSDRRLKTDIRKVGATDSGTPIYTYRYGGQGAYHMGVMADEVPDALGPVVNGYKTVRYEEVR